MERPVQFARSQVTFITPARTGGPHAGGRGDAGGWTSEATRG